MSPVACGRYDAGFALDDPDALVGAALACPACLGATTTMTVALVRDRLDARCTCHDCDSTWSLALAPQQLLRLSLDPPLSADVRWSDRLPPALPPNDLDDDLDA
ncbi:MAG: hypothetical protein QOK49_4600 [Baekduia sp.]|jgi:hypothetical protein|nr:hypothetical protein [Baekduia sp.]